LIAAVLLVASVLLTALAAAAVEYQINFVDGTRLRTSRVRQVGEAIEYEKFGGEASVSVDEVASVYVIESDGTVSWVMQPRRGDGSPAAHPVAAPPAEAQVGDVGGRSTPPTRPTAEAGEGQRPAAVVAPAATPAQKSPSRAKDSEAAQRKGATAGPAPPPAAAPPDDGHTPISAGGESPVGPRSGKVILTPGEPLAKRLLRWGAAPLVALLALAAVLVVFRRKFRAGQQGVPVTGAVGEGGPREVDFSVPSKSWETLVAAIEERDIDVYRLCWQQNYPDQDLEMAFQKILMNWKYYDYSVIKTEPHPNSKERFYLHIKRSTKFARDDLEERVRRISLLLTDGGWKFEELPYGF
jgi:hypothetical protein